MAVLYYSLDINFETCASIHEKIEKLNVLIDLLFDTATKAIATGNHASYKIDDGQSVQEVTYTSMASVKRTIIEYENLKQMYINKLVGNKVRNIGGENLNRGLSWNGRPL